MLRIVNLNDCKLEKNEILIRVDRESVLGNPFRMENYSVSERNRVCNEYNKYFLKKVREEGEFRTEVIKIYSLVKQGYKVALGCHCAPKRCHAEMIVAFVESYL